MNKGFTLVEVLLAMALFGILGFGSLTLYSWATKEGDRVMTTVGRNIENEQMIEYLTQPAYFGALAGFSQNEDLKKCIAADGNLCKVDVDYPLTAMDISEKKPMNSVSGGMAEGIKNTLSFRVHCPVGQSACDKADYFVVKVQTEISKENATKMMVEKTAMVTPEISDVATFIPDATLSPGRSVNVVVFLDNSNSMVYVKDEIKKGLESLTSTLGSLNARVGIYTLSGTDTQTYTEQKYTLSGTTKIPVTSIYSLPNNSVYHTDRSIIFKYLASWAPGSQLYSYGMLDFKTDDTAAVNTAKVNAMNARIDYLFTQSVATATDVPLCGMLQLIESSDPVIPINGDVPTVLMVITNENDDTKFAPATMQAPSPINMCYRAYSLKTIVSNYPTYMGMRQYRDIRVTADMVVDSAPAKVSYSFMLPTDPYNAGFTSGTDCLADVPGQDALIRAQINLKVYGETKFSGTYKATACTRIVEERTIDTDSKTSGLCASNEATYKKISNYVPGTCRETSSYGVSSGGNGPTVPIVSDSFQFTTPDPGLAIFKALEAKGISKNVFFVPIIHRSSDATSCPLTAGASFGTRYESLAARLGAQASPVSICSSDYGSKLKTITQAALSNFGKNDIEIPAAVASALVSIEIKRGSAILVPIKGQDYKLFNTTLIFTPGYLQSTDVVRVLTQ